MYSKILIIIAVGTNRVTELYIKSSKKKKNLKENMCEKNKKTHIYSTWVMISLCLILRETLPSLLFPAVIIIDTKTIGELRGKQKKLHSN